MLEPTVDRLPTCESHSSPGYGAWWSSNTVEPEFQALSVPTAMEVPAHASRDN